MRLQLTTEMIKEIAQELDMGMKCFYHLETREIVVYPDELKNPGFEEEFWEEAMEKIEKNYDKYLAFTGMESYESFEIMEDFIRAVPGNKIQAQFSNALQRRKPFQQFKNLLLNYPDLRQKWFAYKDGQMIKYVEDQVEVYNNMHED